jgi:hypothetical protein
VRLILLDRVTLYNAASLVKLIWLVLFILFPLVTWGTIYYVDPAEGSNGNNGMSMLTAWKSLPGTRNATDDGFDCPTPSGGKINAGDVIYLRSGSTHISRRVDVDSNYYSNGERQNPIMIKRKLDWGAGPFVFDGKHIVIGKWKSLVYVDQVNYVSIDGTAGTTNAYDGIVIQNVYGDSINGALSYSGVSRGSQVEGAAVQFLRFYNNSPFSLSLVNAKNFSIRYVEFDGNGLETASGLQIGSDASLNDNGTVSNCIAHHHGTTPLAGGGQNRRGYVVVNARNISFTGSDAYDNACRGYDLGSDTTDCEKRADNIVINRSRIFANNTGFGFSGDNFSDSCESNFYLLNSLVYGNNTGGTIYQGPTAYILNSSIANNKGVGIYVDAPAAYHTTRLNVRNTICYSNQTGADKNDGDFHFVRTDTLAWPSENCVNNNLYEQGGEEQIIRWDPLSRNYSFAKDGYRLSSWRTDQNQDVQSYDSVEFERHARFADGLGNNFRLTSSSDAIGGGANLTLVWPSDIPETDYNGIRRPVGKWDIGAYQFCTIMVPRMVPSGSRVRLDGTGAGETDPVAYSWTQIGGPLVQLSDPNGVEPEFSAPAVNQDTKLTFSLMVNNGPPTLFSIIVVPANVTALSLNAGWNFISFPKQPADATIAGTLGEAYSKVKIVWGYNNRNKTWTRHKPGEEGNALVAFQTGSGYWVYMDGPASTPISGPDSSASVQLFPGWNLVGYSADNGKEVASSMNGVADKWNLLMTWGNGQWNSNQSEPSAASVALPSIANFFQGKAYWI